MILLLAAAAWADPVILRIPGPERGLVAAVGWPETSVGGWIGPRIGVALEIRPWSAVGASVGGRWRLAGPEVGWRVDASLAGGLSVPTLDAGLALEVTPALRAGRVGERLAVSVGAASPAVLQGIGGVAARVPLQGELILGLPTLGVGAVLGAGAVLSRGVSLTSGFALTASHAW